MSEAVCYALLFADRVIREDNGKVGIIGSFSQINLPAFPTIAQFPWVVFVGFTNLYGKHTITTNLVHDDTTTVVFSASVDVDVPRGNNTELQIPVQQIPLAKPGAHTLTVNIDGSVVASRVMQIAKLEANNG